MNRRILAVASIGLLLGIVVGLLARQSVKVQAAGLVQVTEVKFRSSMAAPELNGTALPLGSDVIGFSCVQGGDGPRCFVLSGH